MAAPDFSAHSQYYAMSTGAGAQNENISPPWCATSPSTQQSQSWLRGMTQMNQSFLSEQTFTPVLPPPTQPSNGPYGLAQNQYPASPNGSHPSHDRQYPPALSYPEWSFNYPPHGPRLPPSIRGSFVGGLPNPAYSNIYHGANTNQENYHMWPQGRPPMTSGLCPARRPPHTASMSANTPNLSYERGHHGIGFGGSSGESHQSQQSDQLHPRLRITPQGPQLQQPSQIQPTRTGVIQYDGHEEGRSSRDPNSQSRRSDRSSSPRTANRRSYALYAGDRTTSSTSSDVEEAAARSPPASRMRAQRERRLRFQSSIQDPTVVFNRHLRKFKESLDRYTLTDLPDVTSPTCDICAKDYSATNVQPSEEEEIAIMLTCGHVFGEFCLDQWLETCKTHKNKITCPMCRKQLVEPPPSPWRASPSQWMATSSEIRRAFPEESTPSFQGFYSSQYTRV